VTPQTATARRFAAPEPEFDIDIDVEAAAPPLRVARPAPGSHTPRPRKDRLLLRPVAVATMIVVASLLAVVIGNMVLASGQLQLEQLQARLATTESKVALKLERFTEMGSPAAAARAAFRDGLVPPSMVLPIPAVSLTQRLGLPTMSTAPCCALTPGR
jgi:hypothetical protein